MSIKTIINRQYAIANNEADAIDLPKQKLCHVQSKRRYW